MPCSSSCLPLIELPLRLRFLGRIHVFQLFHLGLPRFRRCFPRKLSIFCLPLMFMSFSNLFSELFYLLLGLDRMLVLNTNDPLLQIIDLVVLCSQLLRELTMYFLLSCKRSVQIRNGLGYTGEDVSCFTVKWRAVLYSRHAHAIVSRARGVMMLV